MNFFCSSELVILLQTIDASDPYVATSESVGMHLRGFKARKRLPSRPQSLQTPTLIKRIFLKFGTYSKIWREIWNGNDWNDNEHIGKNTEGGALAV